MTLKLGLEEVWLVDTLLSQLDKVLLSTKEQIALS